MQFAYAHTINDAVKLFGIGRTRLYELIAAGRISAVKCGTRTLVLSASLREFIDNLPKIRC